jgi:hypothetical protein
MATATASPQTDQAVGLLKQRKVTIEDELKRIDKALGHLTPNGKVRRPGRPKKAAPASVQVKVKRKRKGGKRADQAVKLIEKDPGIEASAMAKTMKLKPNYLYRVLGALADEGRIKKDGRKYYPAG